MDDVHYFGADGCALFAVVVSGSDEHTVETREAVVVLLHGGGPDHQSLVPLARRIAGVHPVVLPDVRGYGKSICRNRSSHTWNQYAQDMIALLDQLGVRRAILGGAGLGATICLRTAVAYPERVQALLLISIEDIEDDHAKQAEIEFLDAFAERVLIHGIEAAWEPILPSLAPIIGTMVRDAIPRSDPASIAAAAAIGHGRSFRDVNELLVINVPTLIFPGIDARHPTALAEYLARALPNGHLVTSGLTNSVRTTEDFAEALSPAIQVFLRDLAREGGCWS